MQDAVGEGPVVYFNGLGQQVVYNLNLIKFDGGVPKVVDGRPEDPDLTAWLKTLVKQGRLAPVPAVVPAPVELLKLTAAQAGLTGNNVKFDVQAGAVAGEVTVEVTWTDTYAGLTLANIATRLDPAAGRVGLVQLSGPAPTKLPVFSDPVAAPAAPTAITWGFNDENGDVAFTIEPRTGISDANGRFLNVGLDIAAGATTFTLTATWKKKVEHVTSGPLDAIVGPFDFAVKVEPNGTGLPGLGLVQLKAGTDTVAATKATATIFAQ